MGKVGLRSWQCVCGNHLKGRISKLPTLEAMSLDKQDAP